MTLTEKINVVTLPTSAAQYEDGATVTVIGWGVIEDEGADVIVLFFNDFTFQSFLP